VERRIARTDGRRQRPAASWSEVEAVELGGGVIQPCDGRDGVPCPSTWRTQEERDSGRRQRDTTELKRDHDGLKL
jgi:hypothetical protein